VEVRLLRDEGANVVIGWDPVPGATGYRFDFVSGKFSSTWDPFFRVVTTLPVCNTRVSKSRLPVKVTALDGQTSGTYPAAPPPPPPGPGWSVAPPQGNLVEMNGGGTQAAARFDYNVGPVTFEQKWIHDYTSYGYGLMQWPAQESPAGVVSYIRDLRVQRITKTPPRASNGTAEAGVWGGQTGIYERLALEACAWMQVWTGARCYRSIWQDIRMKATQLVGIYPEHNTWDTLFRRFINEESPGQQGNTVNQEWWYSGEGSKNLTYDQFDLYVPAGCWAFFIDAGNGGTKIAPSPGSRIWGPGNGIILPNKIVAGLEQNQAWLNNIDMSQLAGTKLAYHDNAIGTFTQRLALRTRSLAGLAPKLHPATMRMPQPLAARLA
jgi:hypothetical protein